MWVLAAIDPVDIFDSFRFGSCGRPDVQLVESGENAEGEVHAVTVVSRVMPREEGLETSSPVFDVALLSNEASTGVPGSVPPSSAYLVQTRHVVSCRCLGGECGHDRGCCCGRGKKEAISKRREKEAVQQHNVLLCDEEYILK